MAKFYLEETVACWVTFRATIEADNLEAANDICKAREWESDEPPLIGDSIDGYDSTLEASEVY